MSWPNDGGAFITLPQVYTEDVRSPAGDTRTSACTASSFPAAEYEPDREVGLHYQIHRSIGVHHAAAIRAGKPFRVNIFVGGPPAMMLAAVMPLPEGMSELDIRRRARRPPHPHAASPPVEGRASLPIHADADFCICGTVIPNKLLPEGPFGDHLGYYSLAARLSRCCASSTSITATTRSGRSPSSAGRRRKTRSSASSFTSSPAR